jgi:hypothetical protein
MRTHLEFASSAFPPDTGEDETVNPGVFGKRLAEFLAEGLPSHGFEVGRVHPEDWGWRIALKNNSFPLWVGCANYEEFENGFHCFIVPQKSFVRRWLSKVDTRETVERLAGAIEIILRHSGTVSRLRWWSEHELG